MAMDTHTRLAASLLAAAWLTLLSGCAQDGADPAAGGPREAASFALPTGEWRQVVPGPGLPAPVTTFASNNNLDVAMHEGSVFLAFRTAPTHFAGTETTIHVIRTDDPWAHDRWHHEASIHTGKDLREPRLFVHDGGLFLYISELGTELTNFEPGRVFGIRREAAGRWSEPRDVFNDGTIVWRVKSRRGETLLSAYVGGENIYQERANLEPLAVKFMTTDDGWAWHGVDPDHPVVVTGGVSETAFEFAPDGDLFAVSRNETGDHTGFGSRLCRAPADAVAEWTCQPRSDPNKYDSPYMFRYGEDLYLIARYNPNGPFDLMPGAKVTVDRFLTNEVRYSMTTKRTALYGYDTEHMRIVLLDVFPSNGDTAFAAGVWLDDRHHLVFNYSSDFAGPDMSWIEGQFAGSQIYSAILAFPAD